MLAIGRTYPARIGIAGFGAIGRAIAATIAAKSPQLELVGVCTRDENLAHMALVRLNLGNVRIVGIEELAMNSDIVVEAAPSSAFREIASAVLASGTTLVVLSSGALLNNWDLVSADVNGAIVVPSGAIAGIDALRAVSSVGSIDELRLKSIKPPAALIDAPFVVSNKLSLLDLTAPMKVFDGSARAAVEGFPANANVAATLALCGPGPDRTMVEIWADPAARTNAHFISMKSSIVELEIQLKLKASDLNPKSSALAAASVISVLQELSHFRLKSAV